MDAGLTDEPGRAVTGSDPDQIEYVLGVEDHVALRLYVNDKISPVRPDYPAFRRIAIEGGLVVMGVAFFAVVAGFSPLAPIVKMPLVGIPILGAVVWLARAIHKARGEPAEDRRDEVFRQMVHYLEAGLLNLRRRNRVVLSADGFVETNEFSDDEGGVEIVERKETRVRWSAVVEIEATRDHAFLTVAAKGYLVVPRRIFADEAAFTRFLERARSLRWAYRDVAPTAIARRPVSPEDLKPVP